MMLNPLPQSPREDDRSYTRPARRFVGLRLEGLEERAVPAVLTVDADGGKAFTSISAAIAAAKTNDTIKVYDAAADYTEQLTIPAGKNGLKILAAEVGVVLNSPPDVTQATVAGANLGGAIIDIRSVKVTIQGLTLNGATNTDGELFSGIRVMEGGSATIKNNTITGLTTSADAEFGIGVHVGTDRGTGSIGTARLESNTINNYLGVGVLVDGAGSSAKINKNIITGRGAASTFTQHGVQVQRAATAKITSNTIADHTIELFGVGSFGVYLSESVGKNLVSKNNIHNNVIGIALEYCDGTVRDRTDILSNAVAANDFGISLFESDRVQVKRNDVRDSAVYGIITWGDTFATSTSNVKINNNKVRKSGADGIVISGGQFNEIRSNLVFANGANGIWVEESSNNRVWNNRISLNAFSGLYVLGGTGNNLWLTQSIFNVEDGVELENTTFSVVMSSSLTFNAGYGIRLTNADNTTISRNLAKDNGSGSIFIDAASENVTTKGNRIDDPIIDL